MRVSGGNWREKVPRWLGKLLGKFVEWKELTGGADSGAASVGRKILSD